jgi:hypothetical protein
MTEQQNYSYDYIQSGSLPSTIQLLQQLRRASLSLASSLEADINRTTTLNLSRVLHRRQFSSWEIIYTRPAHGQARPRRGQRAYGEAALAEASRGNSG